MAVEEYGDTKETAAQGISLFASLQNNYFTEKANNFPCGCCIRRSPPTKILAWNALATLRMWQEIKGYVIYKVVSFN